MTGNIASYDKILENLKDIKAIAETLSSLSENEPISVESTKTLGFRIMRMSEEAIELLRADEG